MEPVATRQSDSAYERLRELIIQAELRPGMLIEESAMMERLGVGRTPLREALQRLSQEDLIKSVPRRGYFVTETSAADVVHVFEVRQNLEALAARLAADRATAEHLAEFAQLLAKAKKGIAADNQDVTWNLGIDEWFHRLVAEATGNPYLVRAINRHYGLAVRTLYVSRVRITLIKEEIENYETMFQALNRRDANGAEAAMRKHLDFDPMGFITAALASGHRSEAVNRTEPSRRRSGARR